MRLWRSGKSKNVAQIKYAGFNNARDEETIHLYRGLLRQCTYLPESAARKFFRNYIISRFRSYHPRKILSARNQDKRPVRVVEQRRPALLKTARRGLLFLQRANDGHQRHLGKVLAMTYGRIGKRRHDLMEPLLVADIPADQAAVEKISGSAAEGVPILSLQMQALIKEQARKKITFFSRSNRPTTKPDVPETNAWGRPMPVKRVRNIKKRWYSETLDRLMTPLPEAEWNRLRGLASGHLHWEGPVPRRAPFTAIGFNTGIVRGPISRGHSFHSSPHELTARYMRRLWTKLFAQCPLMKPSEARKLGWDVRWGDIHGTKEVALQSESRAHTAMFSGVDEHGKILRA